MNHVPETPLPWADDPTAIYYQIADLHYIVHACNAYPKLIEFVEYALRASDIKVSAHQLLKELGEL